MGRHRAGILVASAFFLISIALGGVLPLWLDEIIQLRETRGTTPAQLVASLPNQPGAAPLGYLIQQASLDMTGYSERLARFPSALFVAGAVFVVALTGSEMGARAPWIGALLLAMLPLTDRYASEGRVYSQAFFFAVLATLLFVRLSKAPNWARMVFYCVALTAAVYAQPYAIFVAPAHVLWAVMRRDRRLTVMSSAACAAAIAAFLPWYFWARSHWSTGLVTGDVHFTVSAKTPLMVFREIAGAGYWGSGLLAVLIVLAWRRRGEYASLLALLIAVPVVLALGADATGGYFVATRQMMWALPAVAILAAMGIEKNLRVAGPVTGLLALVCVWQTVHYFSGPKEDWKAAAAVLAEEVHRGACVIVVPTDQRYTYTFFQADLARTVCPAPRTVVAFTPYTTPAQRDSADHELSSGQYRRSYSKETGKSEIAVYIRESGNSVN